jgi:hypothetical protein
MMDSLKQGVVLQRSQNGRNEFMACPLPFAAGKAYDSHCVYMTVGTASSAEKMALVHPSRKSEIPAKILLLANKAKHSKCVLAKSATQLLERLEKFSSCALTSVSSRDRALNVALGGSQSLGSYGKFIPCSHFRLERPFLMGPSQQRIVAVIYLCWVYPRM